MFLNKLSILIVAFWFPYISNGQPRPSYQLLKKQFAELDSAVTKNPTDTEYLCCSYAISIMERASKIESASDGTIMGKLSFTLSEYGKWKAWMNANDLEYRILDTIWHLPEVKSRRHYVRKETKGKKKLKVVIWKHPTKHSPYYWIKVNEENPSIDYTHFNFLVDSSGHQIRYYDVVNDKHLTLKAWRRQSKVNY